MRYVPLLIGIVLLAGCSVLAPEPPKIEQPHADLIHITSPRPGSTVAATFTVIGEARGTWYFEATFPFAVENMEGDIIGQSYAQAMGEWMTEEFVPFSGQISLNISEPMGAVLVVANSNPSGLPEHHKEVRIPISIGR